jgi:DNA-binding transcriptional regulator GbsR (MarR family)
MSDKIRKDLARRELVRAFQRAGKRKAATDYETAQKAFWKNYERLGAERLAREAAKSKEK